MNDAAFLRVKKLKGCGILAVAAIHNKRTIQVETGTHGSIDPTRSHLNYCLTGQSTAKSVAQLARDLMTAAGVPKLRKDAVRGIEAVFSLPVGTVIDTRAYFTDCLDWAVTYFGSVANILSFDVHLDEAAPHAHGLILPLVNGRMDGSAMLGAKSKLREMQSQFYDRVAKRYGLRKAFSKLTGEAKTRATAQVLTYLRETGDTALQSLAWQSIREAIEGDPGPFLLALGLVAAPELQALKPFAHYVTSKGKGPAKERDESKPKPIGFIEHWVEREQSLCSVGFAHPPAFETHVPAANDSVDTSDFELSIRGSNGRRDGQQKASPRHNSTIGNIATAPRVGNSLDVRPTECELASATYSDEGEDF
jgi:hypothetical protein